MQLHIISMPINTSKDHEKLKTFFGILLNVDVEILKSLIQETLHKRAKMKLSFHYFVICFCVLATISDDVTKPLASLKRRIFPFY